MNRKTQVAMMLALIVALAAAISSGQALASPASAPLGATQTVQLQDFKFAPTTITIAVGDSINFTNAGAVAHTATAGDGSWDSGNLNPGQSFSHTFSAAGTFIVYCRYHGQANGTGMAMTVTVGAAAATATTGAASPTAEAATPTTVVTPTAEVATPTAVVSPTAEVATPTAVVSATAVVASPTAVVSATEVVASPTAVAPEATATEVVAAPTATTAPVEQPTNTPTSSTIGLPNTGAGPNPGLWLILVLGVMLVIAGGLLLRRRRTA